MNLYTASNGVGLTITRDRTVRWRPGIPPDLVSSALREYFQVERDEALGRWRDPENPDWICYGRGSSRDTVHVINEYDGLPYMLERGQVAYSDAEFSAVAQRYFEAHPKPKPWEKARPGCDEIWVLTIHGCEQPVYVDEFCGEPVFQVPGGETISLHRESITAGRRIWPEENK